jgi:hypothetical protein
MQGSEPGRWTDEERLVEFWHTQDFGKFLDEAARDVLASLDVTAERDRLRDLSADEAAVELAARHPDVKGEAELYAAGVGSLEDIAAAVLRAAGESR